MRKANTKIVKENISLLKEQKRKCFDIEAGIELKYTQKELYETILNVASGSVDYNGLLQWVLNHQN